MKPRLQALLPVLFYLSGLIPRPPPFSACSPVFPVRRRRPAERYRRAFCPLSHWSALRESGALHFGQNFTLGAGRCSLHSIMPILHETAAVDHQLVLKVLGDHIGYGGHRPFLSLADRPGQGSRTETVSPVPVSHISAERLKVLTFP